MTKDEALKLSLEALKRATNYDPLIARAITVIKEALAQPAQEPVALPDWFNHAFPSGTLEAVGFHMPTPRAYAEELYKRWKRRFEELSTPPQRTWVGLTDEEVRKICVNEWGGYEQCRAIEAKLKERNDHSI